MKTLPEAPHSYWSDTYGDYQPKPQLSGSLRCDVAIIGGGLVRGYLIVEDAWNERGLSRF